MSDLVEQVRSALSDRYRVEREIGRGPGLFMERARPEVDQINFLPRITVLMFNGTYDNLFPTGTSQQPFFALLGPASRQKRRVLDQGGHFIGPRDRLIAESLDWLDKYLGPPDEAGADLIDQRARRTDVAERIP